MWSRYEAPATASGSPALNRMADAFLDARARTEHGKQSYLDMRQAVLDRLETGIGEPAGEGSPRPSPSSGRPARPRQQPRQRGARSQVLARGAGLADAVEIQARNFASEAGDQRMALLADVDEVNTIAGTSPRPTRRSTPGGGSIPLEARAPRPTRLWQRP